MDKKLKKALKNKHKKSAGARTNIHNKRIEAIKAVRESKGVKKKFYESLGYDGLFDFNISEQKGNPKYSEKIKKGPIKRGIDAEAVLLKDKVVKSKRHDRGGSVGGKSISHRAKSKMDMSKYKITPDALLVETSKDNYLVSDKLKKAKNKLKEGFFKSGDMNKYSDLDKKIFKLSDKAEKSGHILEDLHTDNVMTDKDGRLKNIDTGHAHKMKEEDLHYYSEDAKPHKRRKGLNRKEMKQTIVSPKKVIRESYGPHGIVKKGDKFLEALSKNLKKGVKRLPVIAGAVGLGSALMEEGQARERSLDDALDPVPFGADRVEAPTLTKNQVTEYMKRKYATDPDYRKQRKLRGK